MAYYKPCKNCAANKASCARRNEVASGIAGLHVTVVNFVCHDRQALFRPGQRVSFVWTAWDSGDPDEQYGLGLVFYGTVLGENGLRFIVRVDDGPSACESKVAARDVFKSETLVIKVKPSDMIALEEPDRALCPACSAYEGESGRCQGWEDPGWYSYWPEGCFAKREKAA